jgi:hypothetical protein
MRKNGLLAGTFLLASAALAQIQGAEIFRRTLPAGSVVRIYQGNTLASATAVAGDTRITIGQGTPQPPPTPVLSALEVPAELKVETNGMGRVRLSGPATAPTSVSLVSEPANILTVPGSVMIPAGAISATFPLSAGAQAGGAQVAALKGTVRLVKPVTVTAAKPEPPEPEPPEPEPEPGGGWYVSPTGSPRGAGTRENPWDLESTINGSRRSVLVAGGTVWLMGGTYRIPPANNREGLGYRCVVGGSANSPLVFRAFPGARAVLDGGWSFFGGSNYVALRDVEVIVSDLVPGKPPFGESGSWPAGAPNGGVNFYTSFQAKAINCVIRQNRQGLSMWTEAREAEAYGNLIFDNGWVGSDRAHGHGCYIQNPSSTTKRVIDNIFCQNKARSWPDGRYELHGYGQTVAITNITAEGNFGAQSNNAWLLDDGAVLGPSTGHRFNGNDIVGVRVRLGSRPDQPLELKGNVIAGELQVSTGPEVSAAGNLIVPPQARPAADQVILRPNRYEPNRANCMLIDWNRNGKVMLDASGWLQAGERVRLMLPWDFYGTPVWSGQWPTAGVELPVEGARALVVMKGAQPGERLFEEAPVSPRLHGAHRR